VTALCKAISAYPLKKREDRKEKREYELRNNGMMGQGGGRSNEW
jgi:hypothetical protein